MTQHRFTDDEIRRIFERAAERHEEAERARSEAPEGLTLAELQEIGSHAGIDRAHVAAAARELIASGRVRPSPPGTSHGEGS